MNRAERRRAMHAAGYRRAEGKKGGRPAIRVPRLSTETPAQPEPSGLLVPTDGGHAERTKSGVVVPKGAAA